MTRTGGFVAAALIATLLALPACGGGDEPEAVTAGPSSGRMELRPAGTEEGAPLGYAEYLPPGYGDGEPKPLLVFLHGVDENGDGSRAALRRLSKLGIPNLIQNDRWPENRPFVVLMPQYGPERANDCRLGDDIDSFLDYALEHYDVDARRVYLTGVSCGAIGGWDYLARHRDETVAAAVLISAHARDAIATAGCDLGRVPIWAFHGAADSTVPKVHIVEPVEQLKRCDPKPTDLRLTIYPRADHDVWTRTYNLSAGHDIYRWLLEHERG